MSKEIEKDAMRSNHFKKTVSADDARRSRNETTINLRKNKRDAQLSKRRNSRVPVVAISSGNAFVPVAPSGSPSQMSNLIREAVNVFQQKLDKPQSVSNRDLHAKCQSIRRLLSRERGSPFAQVVQAGLIHYFAKISAILPDTTNEPMVDAIHVECLWSLTNIASDSYTQQVADSGVVPRLAYLTSQHAAHTVREQAGWCLGNIAGHSITYRDAVLQTDHALTGLLRNLEVPETSSLLNNYVWVASNLVRGKPTPPWNVSGQILGRLREVLKSFLSKKNEKIYTWAAIIDLLWALSYISDGDKERIQLFLDSNILDSLVCLMGRDDSPSEYAVPMLRTLGNIVTGSDEQTQIVVDSGVLPHVKKLLDVGGNTAQKEACWLFSNVAAGTVEQSNYLLDSNVMGDLLFTLCCKAWNANSYETRKEAQYALCEIIKTGDATHTHKVMNADGMDALVGGGMVSHGDPKCVKVILETFIRIFEWGAKTNREEEYKRCFEECDGVTKLEEFQSYSDDAVYSLCVEILEKYFDGEMDVPDENISATGNADGTLSFGLSKQLFPNVAVSKPFDFTGVGKQSN